MPEPSYPYRHPFGNNCGFCWDIIMGRKNMLEVFGKQYNEMKDHPFYGTHTFTGNPAIVVNDPDLLRSVLSKDFHHFTDRLSQSLVRIPFTRTYSCNFLLTYSWMDSMMGDSWPTFSGGKQFSSPEASYMYNLFHVKGLFLITSA